VLGLVVFFMIAVPGYVASRGHGGHEVPNGAHVTGGAQVIPSTTDATRFDEALETAPDSPGIDSHIRDAASRYDVSETLIAAIIEVESRFDSRAVSSRGALGLMQLMPETAATLGVRDPFDPRENIEGGVRHLRAMMARFRQNLPLALAAYNAGERAVIQHRGIPPYGETREYVVRILELLHSDRAKSVDEHGASAARAGSLRQ
jgi:soluble lytic murein transglycosylase-like protein